MVDFYCYYYFFDADNRIGLRNKAVNKKICIPHLDLKDFARLIGKLKCGSVYNIIKIYASKNYLWSDVIDSFKTVPYEQF